MGSYCLCLSYEYERDKATTVGLVDHAGGSSLNFPLFFSNIEHHLEGNKKRNVKNE